MFAAALLQRGGAQPFQMARVADMMLDELKGRFPEAETKLPAHWIEWQGGEFLDNPTAEVCVQLRDGTFLQRMAMNIEWGWDDEPHHGDVVAYMVLKR